MNIYRKVMTADRLPDESNIYDTDMGSQTFSWGLESFIDVYGAIIQPEWWFEEVLEITDMKIMDIMDKLRPIDDRCDRDFWSGYFDGFKKAIEIIKGGK